MPRIRTIKPEFWDDEKLAKMSLPSNLLYVAMWNHADDEGVIRSGANWIKSTVFPHRENLRLEEVKAWIKELEDSRMIVPFQHNQEGYYVIRNFKKHQRIDKPQPSKIPIDVIDQFREDSKNVPRTFPVGMEGNGLEGNGLEGNGEGAYTRAREEIFNFFKTNFRKYRPQEAAKFDREQSEGTSTEVLGKKRDKIISDEVDRFWNHYEKQDWKTKGGARITNKLAGFKSWMDQEKRFAK